MNGNEAINAIERYRQLNELNPCYCAKGNHNYRLVLMDCNMPVMDGIQATTLIRSNKSLKQDRIFIAALTAYHESEFKGLCFKAGMNEFLNKPINSEDLGSLLRQ